MARRKTRDDYGGMVTVVFLSVLCVAYGLVDDAQVFVLSRLPLFTGLGVALVLLLALVLGQRSRRARRRRARQRQLDAQVASTDGMTGPEFERLVARLLRRDGYTNVRVVGGASDLGADVLATAPDGRKIVVQCKRYATSRKVPSPDMQKFLGTCFNEHGADRAWFVTTTAFSKPARELGARRGVRLVDRNSLAMWMATTAPASTQH